jgi:tetratricopeptide (TPR) repeat protein
VAKKISRKELLKKDDAFIAAAGQSAKWAQDNKPKIIAAGVAGFVLILSLWGAFEYLHVRDVDASKAFQEAMAVMGAEVVSDADASTTSDERTFASDKEKWEEALHAFQKVQTAAGSSEVGKLARFYIGSLHEKLENKEAALEVFGALAESLSSEDELYFLAKERQAYLYEDLGQVEQALTAFTGLAQLKGFYADYAGYHQARLLAAKGDVEKARNILQRLKNDYPESSLKDEIERHLKKIPGKDVAAAKAETPASSTN